VATQSGQAPGAVRAGRVKEAVREWDEAGGGVAGEVCCSGAAVVCAAACCPVWCETDGWSGIPLAWGVLDVSWAGGARLVFFSAWPVHVSFFPNLLCPWPRLVSPSCQRRTSLFIVCCGSCRLLVPFAAGQGGLFRHGCHSACCAKDHAGVLQRTLPSPFVLLAFARTVLQQRERSIFLCQVSMLARCGGPSPGPFVVWVGPGDRLAL